MKKYFIFLNLLFLSIFIMFSPFSPSAKTLQKKHYPFSQDSLKLSTGQPAMTDEDIETFQKVNTIAETMRLKEAENYFKILKTSEKKSSASSYSGCATGALGQMLMEEIMNLMTSISWVDAAACKQADFSLIRYHAFLQRIKQVQELLELEADLVSKRMAVKNLEEKDPTQIAEEGLDFVYKMERGRIVSWKRVIEEKIERDKQNSLNQWNHKIKRAKKRLENFDKWDKSHKETIKMLHYKINKLQNYPANQPHIDKKKIENEIAKNKSKLERLKSGIKKRDIERKDLKEFLKNNSTPPKIEINKEDQEALKQIQEKLRVFDEEMSSGRFLQKLADNSRKHLEQKRQELILFEEKTTQILKEPSMQQALLDRSTVLKHAHKLMYFDSPLINLPPKEFLITDNPKIILQDKNK